MLSPSKNVLGHLFKKNLKIHKPALRQERKMEKFLDVLLYSHTLKYSFVASTGVH